MNTPNESTAEFRPWDALVAAHVEAILAGRTPSRQALIDAHPEWASALRAFFTEFDRSGSTPTNPPTTPMPMVAYFGDYELLEEIARGEMGIVYRARQKSLNRVVALKVLLAGTLATPKDVQRFHGEAEAAANLDHPNIVPLYEIGQHEGRQYFTMKYIAGSNLSEWQRLHSPSDSRSVVNILRPVVRAVHYAHQRGILHRDLKPANILMDEQSTPYVSDFGLAKRIDSGASITETGLVVGTPKYMAPEQASGRPDMTLAADVYSLGAILYELVAGRPPFVGDNAIEILRQVREVEPTHPSAIVKNVDRDLSTICLKCLEKDPAKRYESAAALADDLERWWRGEPIVARPVGRVERSCRWAKRNPALASLTALAVLFLMSGTLVSTWFAWKAHQRALGETQMRERADDYAKDLQRQAGANSRLLTQLCVEKGYEYEKTADWNRALLWYAEPLARGGVESVHANTVRRRLAYHLAFDHAPRPHQSLPNVEPMIRRWFCADDSELICWHTDHQITRFRIADQQTLWRIPAQHRANVYYAPATERMITLETIALPFVGYYLQVKLWNAADGSLLSTIHQHAPNSIAVQLDPTGTRLAIEDGSTNTQIYSLRDGALQHRLMGRIPTYTRQIFRADGQRIMLQAPDKSEYSLWNVTNGQQVGTMAHGKNDYCTGFQPQGDTIVVAAVSNPLPRKEEISFGEVSFRYHRSNGQFVSRQWQHIMPNDLTIHESDYDVLVLGERRVWDTAIGKEFYTLPDSSPFRTFDQDIEFSPDRLWAIGRLRTNNSLLPTFSWRLLQHQTLPQNPAATYFRTVSNDNHLALMTATNFPIEGAEIMSLAPFLTPTAYPTNTRTVAAGWFSFDETILTLHNDRDAAGVVKGVVTLHATDTKETRSYRLPLPVDELTTVADDRAIIWLHDRDRIYGQCVSIQGQALTWLGRMFRVPERLHDIQAPPHHSWIMGKTAQGHVQSFDLREYTSPQTEITWPANAEPLPATTLVARSDQWEPVGMGCAFDDGPLVLGNILRDRPRKQSGESILAQLRVIDPQGPRSLVDFSDPVQALGVSPARLFIAVGLYRQTEIYEWHDSSPRLVSTIDHAELCTKITFCGENTVVLHRANSVRLYDVATGLPISPELPMSTTGRWLTGNARGTQFLTLEQRVQRWNLEPLLRHDDDSTLLAYVQYWTNAQLDKTGVARILDVEQRAKREALLRARVPAWLAVTPEQRSAFHEQSYRYASAVKHTTASAFHARRRSPEHTHTAEEVLEQGERLARERRWADAEKAFAQAVARSPDSLAGWRGLLHTQLAQGKPISHQAFLSAMQHQPASEWESAIVWAVWVPNNHVASTLAHAEAAVRRQRTRETLLAQGAALVRAKQYPQAITALNEALVQANTLPNHQALGQLVGLAQGPSWSTLSVALAMGPRPAATPLLLLALSNARQGQIAEARTRISQARWSLGQGTWYDHVVEQRLFDEVKSALGE